jgi:hypothetical protein
MIHLLQRHPFPVEAFFRHTLVLTYAYPRSVLEPLLPPGLLLDTYKGFGFLAIALVQTKNLRPAGWPEAFGQDFFLTGYRLFARYRAPSGLWLRGLRILRSDTDRRAMACFGNLLTHYHYRKAEIFWEQKDALLEIQIRTPGAEADLHVLADLSGKPAPLPPGSPFEDIQSARKFAGPLPFTFDYEAETHSIIRIKGVRRRWNPQPVTVKVIENTFLRREPYCSAEPVLANAFHLEEVPYLWKKGIREPLEGGRP